MTRVSTPSDEAAENNRRANSWKTIVGYIGSRYARCRLAEMTIYDDRQKAAIETCRKYAEAMPANVAAGRSITWFGTVGTGKDFMAASLMSAAVWKFGLEVVWRNGLDLYGDIRDSIGGEMKESTMIRALASPEILVISDPLPPFGDVTPFQAQTLYRILDARYRQMRPTWLTLNVADGAEAAKRMGAAVVDRMRDQGLLLECKWPSFRARSQN